MPADVYVIAASDTMRNLATNEVVGGDPQPGGALYPSPDLFPSATLYPAGE